MNANDSLEPGEDSRLPDLRVRIKRIANSTEATEIMRELIAMGHAAAPLVPTLAEHMHHFVVSADVLKLIVKLKCPTLVHASLEAGIQFRDFELAELLKAGFSEFEAPLVDKLWKMKDDNSFFGAKEVLEALGPNAQNEETLITLKVLQDHLEKRERELTIQIEEEDSSLGQHDIRKSNENWLLVSSH